MTFPGIKRLAPLWPSMGGALIHGDACSGSAQHTKGQMAARGQLCTLSGEAERPAWEEPPFH